MSEVGKQRRPTHPLRSCGGGGGVREAGGGVQVASTFAFMVCIASLSALPSCALNTSRFHSNLAPIDFDILATKTFPPDSTREQVISSARREGLTIDDAARRAAIHPRGLYSTSRQSRTDWSVLEFHYNEVKKLDHMTYGYWTPNGSRRYTRDVQWMGELQ